MTADIRWEDYEDERNWITFGDQLFLRRCPICLRFVKPDETIRTYDEYPHVRTEMNATCSRCGRVQMPHYGFVE